MFPDSSDINLTAVTPELLMNAGFAAKELRQYNKALQFFILALKSHPKDSILPYLYIEIGSILKIKGNYDDAIKLFSTAQKNPALINNQQFQQELINMIAYLRIIKNYLYINNLDLVPFSEIPNEIMHQIDNEYNDWNKIEEAI